MNTFLPLESLYKKYGFQCANLLRYLIEKITRCQDQGHNLIHDRTWFFASLKQIAQENSHLSVYQIYRALAKLVRLGILVKGNHSADKMDRTTWYAFKEESRFLGERKVHFAKPQNAFCENLKEAKDTRNIYIYKTTSKEEAAQPPAAASFAKTEKAEATVSPIPAPQPTIPMAPTPPNSPAHPPAIPGSRPPPRRFQPYECLAEVPISLEDKVWLTRHHTEDEVKHAVSWATANQNRIRTTMVQAIKWAVKARPEMKKSEEDQIRENKEIASNLVSGLEIPNILQVDILSKGVELVFTGCQKVPIFFEYKEKTFSKRLTDELFRYGCKPNTLKRQAIRGPGP